MNIRSIVRMRIAAKWLLVFASSIPLAGCSPFAKPDEARPVLTSVYSPSVGKDVYSSLSPSHFLE